MKKRLMTFALSAVLLAGNGVHAFSDVGDDHWAKDNISFLTGMKILKGYDDGLFHPNRQLTREEASAIISRIIGDKVSSNDSLTDIENRWSTNSIKNLINEGIVTGYEDGTFRPTDKINRAEFVSIVYRYLKNENKLSLGTGGTKLIDIQGNWAEDYIHVLSGMNIIKGYPDGRFLPEGLITRAEASAIITNMLLIDKNFTVDPNASEEEKKEQILKFIEKNYGKNINIDELRDKSIAEIFAIIGDSNSKYMDRAEYQNMKSNLKGEFVGIGVHLMANNNDQIEVFAVVDDSPASKAGIKPGDIIHGIDGKSYQGYEVFVFTKQLDGVVGTTLELDMTTTDEYGNKVPVKKTLVREAIKLRTVFPKMISDNIGYMRITQFEHPTGNDYLEKIEELKNMGAKSLILDLRYNGGGIVSSAKDIADSFLSEGIIYKIIKTDGTENVIQANSSNINMPFVLLVNERTASASEIIAASVKDHKNGKIVGTRTYGKGTVQTMVDLPDGTGFKLTIGEYYSPFGNRIDKVGIEPDYVIDMGSIENIGPDNIQYDKQLLKAVELLNQ